MCTKTTAEVASASSFAGFGKTASSRAGLIVLGALICGRCGRLVYLAQD